MEHNIINVWFEDDKIFIQTSNGEKRSHPLNWFPKLQKASKEVLESFTLSPFGIHWEKLDEDLSYEGFFTYVK
ncbi:DUF2442 domain-containing protein [Algoriphagus antarcticus]|uniref:Uncharacterized protein DUF2442 n=1 Tax=Algoriphagus antarcticus TaxID=238540 RepID=A0A3E0D6D1_9BACT|nr:DUF2442 domain-containing protein [Algoriphagus antarcticus]REG77491.1 uncharacterized protein DUF2442 [Algoriphagus antarcticus]